MSMDIIKSNVNRLKSINLILLVAFIISRILFINTKNIFFDSGEYIHLFSQNNFLQALTYGHAPPHEGYILLFWPIFHMAPFLHFDPIYGVIYGQILLASLTVYCFYQVVRALVDKLTAFIASVLIAMNPLFWISNITIMMEIAYCFFLFSSLYFLICYLKKSSRILQLYFSLLLLTLAVLTHPMIIFWIPLYLSLIYFKKRELMRFVLLNLVLFLSVGLLLNALLLSSILSMNLQTTIQYLYLSKGGELPILTLDIKSFLIIMRNFLIPLLRNNSFPVIFLGMISLLTLLITQKKLFIIGLLWIAPALYANQWWDSLLNGRHALVAGFGFAFLAAYVIRQKALFVFATICYLSFFSLPLLDLLKQPIPYLTEAEYVKSLPKDSLLLESHFARPQVQEIKMIKIIFVNEPGFDKKLVTKTINKYLAARRPVFISSAALSEPYGLYSGPYVHNITLSYTKPFELEPVMSHYTLKIYKEICRKDNLIIYQLVSNKPSSYPHIPSLKYSYRRLDYYDPLWRTGSYILENNWRK